MSYCFALLTGIGKQCCQVDIGNRSIWRGRLFGFPGEVAKGSEDITSRKRCGAGSMLRQPIAPVNVLPTRVSIGQVNTRAGRKRLNEPVSKTSVGTIYVILGQVACTDWDPSVLHTEMGAGIRIDMRRYAHLAPSNLLKHAQILGSAQRHKSAHCLSTSGQDIGCGFVPLSTAPIICACFNKFAAQDAHTSHHRFGLPATIFLFSTEVPFCKCQRCPV